MPLSDFKPAYVFLVKLKIIGFPVTGGYGKGPGRLKSEKSLFLFRLL